MTPRQPSARRSLTVRPRLPEPIVGLATLADNLRWTWHAPTRALFGEIDPHTAIVGDPRTVLADAPSARLEQLAADEDFVQRVSDAVEELNGESTAGTPFGYSVAYFSPEYGITESMAQYSGGLGVLAADHLKAAGDMAVPLVAVGLFYRHGYFHQRLTVDGWQEEYFEDNDPHALPMTEVAIDPILVEVAGRDIALRVWRVDVGRIPLYLLDADLPQNPEDLRLVTDRLYGGDVEHRLRQELVLGVGGVRALDALGAMPTVFHTNEGHAGFLGLERIRTLIKGSGLDFSEATQAVRATSVFTTHTPVPAGIDRFPRELMERYFSTWALECGIDIDGLMALGHEPHERSDRPFNMAVMGMRLSRFRNGVSAKHGRTSREMFASLWPDVPVDEVPITHVTNGVHAETWTGPEVAGALEGTTPGDLDPQALRTARDTARARLVTTVRDRLRSRGLAAGRSPSELRWTESALDPKVPTVGFARRMATHKRAALLLEHPDRLRAMLSSTTEPIQFVFAGKAHPGDEAGKEMVRRLVSFANEPTNRNRFVFLEDYDIALARSMVQGVDIWLNTPMAPLEASGTSGMKAALNGAINLSVLDGWWDECFDPGSGPSGTPNGWAISATGSATGAATGTATGTAVQDQRAELDANSLYEILEHQVIPLFHGTAEVGHDWHDLMVRSLETLTPRVTARRMVDGYAEHLYEPAAALGRLLSDDDHSGARDLAAFVERARDLWNGVQVYEVSMDESVGELGAPRDVRAAVHLGGLAPSEVQVQAVVGHLGAGGEITDPQVVQMALEEPGDDPGDVTAWTAQVELSVAGRMGVTVRVMPQSPYLGSGTTSGALDLGLVRWAQ